MSNRGRGDDIPLTAHLEDHDRDEWLALTRFLQPINPDPTTRIAKELKMALSTKSGETVKMLRLPPHHRVSRWIEYFYEGYVDVLRGEAQVPVEKTEWVQRMLNTGYAIPKDEPYLETAPQVIVDSNRNVWLQTYPHLAASEQDVYAEVAIIDGGPEAQDEPDGPVDTGSVVEDDGSLTEDERDAPEVEFDDGVLDEDA